MSKRIYNTLDNDTLDKIHKVELEIFEEVIKICNNHNLKYFLVGGTLLGAVRHKGFIPWDDDMDIGMFREDYDKFIDIAINEISDKYFVHCTKTDKNYWLPFTKIRKNNTTFDEKLVSGKDVLHNGIFVDIFPFDSVGNNYSINRFRGGIIRTISDNLLVKGGVFTYKDSRHPIVNHLLAPFSKNFLVKKQVKLMKASNKNEYIINWAGAYHIKRELFPKVYTEPLVDVEFAGIKCKAFCEYKKYLTNVYGDFMKLPPEEERVNHGAAYISFKEGSNIISKDVVR